MRDQARDSFLVPTLSHLEDKTFPCGSKRAFVPVPSFRRLKSVFWGPILQILALERNCLCCRTQVCYVQFLDIKQNGRRIRGTITFRFILCLNVGRLSKNSRNSICPIYTWLWKRQKFAITSTNHVWLVFSAPYENISKGKKAVVRISDFGHKNRFKWKHRLKTY